MGGILGLCTGFSLVTGVEIFYWFTIRLVSDHLKKKKVEASEDKAPMVVTSEEFQTLKENLKSQEIKIDSILDSLDQVKSSIKSPAQNISI